MNIFTNDDYRRIQAWLKANAVKDSDLPEITGSDGVNSSNDILTIVHTVNGIPNNFKIKLSNLLNLGLSQSTINLLTSNEVKVNNKLTVDASKITISNSKGTTLQDIIDYFENNKLNRNTDDTINGSFTVNQNLTVGSNTQITGNAKINGNIEVGGTTKLESDVTITNQSNIHFNGIDLNTDEINTLEVRGSIKATEEITDGYNNQLSDVNSASRGWKIEYRNPSNNEPTVRAEYVLTDYNGVPKGDIIKVYKDSAITNVYLGTTEDTIDVNTGEVTKHVITENNEALSIVYKLDTGKYSLVNIPLGAFIREAEFDNTRGLGVTGNGQVFVKLASDTESTNYLHFNDSGEISADGIEARISSVLGSLYSSDPGDSTMWGQYKQHEGNKNDSISGDNSRWGQFKEAEAIREATSDSAHIVFADNWDTQVDNPTAWEDPIATETSYAYNWKTTDTPANDGSTQGNIKDLYNRAVKSSNDITSINSTTSELNNRVSSIEDGNTQKIIQCSSILQSGKALSDEGTTFVLSNYSSLVFYSVDGVKIIAPKFNEVGAEDCEVKILKNDGTVDKSIGHITNTNGVFTTSSTGQVWILYYNGNSQPEFNFTNKYLKKGITKSKSKVLWLGTSIPAGDGTIKKTYPLQVQENLNLNVLYNNSIGSSGIVLNEGYLGNGRDGLDLTETVAEKESRYRAKVNDGTITEQTLNIYKNSSFEKVLLPYINGTIDSCDVVIIDHGFNDRAKADAEKDSTILYTDTDRSTFIGAFNYLITKIYEVNPKIKIIIVGFYMKDNCEINNVQMYGNSIDTILSRLSGYYNFMYIPTYNGSCINPSNFSSMCPDYVHPHSDADGIAVNNIAKYLTNSLRDIIQ